MAVVPFSGLPNQQPSTQSLGRQSDAGATPAAFGGGLADGLTDVGATLLQRGEMLQQHAVAFQQINNTTEGNNSYTKYLNSSNTLLFGDGSADNPGFYNLKGQAAIDAFGPTKQKLQDLSDEIANGSSNPIVKNNFLADSRRLMSYNLTDMSRHAAQARQQWISDTRSGTLFTLTNDAGLNYNDPTRVANNLAAGLDIIKKDGIDQGHPPETIAADQLKYKSGVFSSVIDRMADEDLFKAKAFFDKYKGQMTAPDQMRYDHFFKGTLQPLAADRAANNALAIGPSPTPKYSGDAPFSGVTAPIHSEDVAPYFQKSGFIITGKGRTPEENARANGTANSAHLLANGNRALDIHASPGLTADAVKAQATALGLPNPKVIYEGPGAKHSTAPHFHLEWDAGKEGGTTPTAAPTELAGVSTDIKDHLGEYLARGDQLAQADIASGAVAPANADVYRKQVADSIRGKVGQVAAAQTGAQNEANGRILNAIHGGPDGSAPLPRGINDLYASYPQAKQDWATLTSKQQDVLLHRIQQNASGNTVKWSEKGDEVYSRLMGEYYTAPDKFKAEDFLKDPNIVGTIPGNMLRSLIAKQQKLDAKAPPNEKITHAISVANDYGLKQVASRTNNPTEYSTFVGRLGTEIDHFQSIHNRYPNDNDIGAMTTRLLNKQGGWNVLGMNIGGTREYKEPYVSEISGVPDNDARDLSEVYRLHYHREPSDDDLVKLYNSPAAIAIRAKRRGK